MAKPDSLSTHVERWHMAQDARAPWDREARLDLRTLAGKTWKKDELDVFEAQGRDPADYNLVAGTMRLVAGVEAQSRSDAKYLGRGPSDQEGAEAATKAAMLVRDQNSGERQLSRAFWNAITTGVGWMETAGDPDPYSIGIKQQAVNPFHIWWDPCGKEPDQSDWIDMFRSLICYPQQLAVRFSKWKSEILAASEYIGEGRSLSHSSDYTDRHNDYPDVARFEDYPGGFSGNRPRQIRAVERWYKQEEWAQLVRFRDGRVYEPDAADIPLLRFLARAIVSGEAKRLRALVPRIRVAVFLPDAPGLLLSDEDSPYDHRRFPFTPLWTYEDEEGRPMGLIRQSRIPQRDLNARMSHLLKASLSNQVWFEEGAFVDEREGVQEMAKTAGVVRLTEGGLQKVQRGPKLEGAAVEQYLIGFDQKMIQEYSGVTAEMLGQETNASSGTAIQARQAQGQTRLFTLFDNRNWCQERTAELTLSLMRQTFTEELAVRVTESSRGVEFITINEQQPDGTVRNDLKQGMFDAKVTLTGAKAVEQLQALESWSNFASQLPPDLQIFVAPHLARLSQIPDGQQFVEELEQLKDMAKERMMGPPPGAMPPQGGPPPGAPPPTQLPPGTLPEGPPPDAMQGVA